MTMTREPHDWNADEFDREDYYHGTDEYVSDCNRLPFSESMGKEREPMSKRESTCCTLTCLSLPAVLCGGVYGACKLIKLLLH